MSESFAAPGTVARSPLPSRPLVVAPVPLDAHHDLVGRAVDRFDVAAHLEASGFGDALARRHGARDVYEYARTLPTLAPGASGTVSLRPRAHRQGWIRAILLLAGAVVMALCAPAAVGSGPDLSLAIVATGLSGWILGQLLGFVTWRRSGLGDLPGAARVSVGVALLVATPLVAGVTLATAHFGNAPLIPTAALCSAWTLYAASLTIVSVLGGLRLLTALAGACATVAVAASLLGAALVPVIALGVLSIGGALLAARTYRATTVDPPTLPSREDARAAFDGASQAILMSSALLMALNLADSDDRIPLSIAVILAAALCDPAIEDLGIRLKSLSYRSGRWRSVLNGVLVRTLMYLAAIAAATIAATWIVDRILGVADDPASGLVPDVVVLVVVAPVFAVFAFGSAIVLRAGRVAEAVWISGLACLGFATLRFGFPVPVGVAMLCGACLLAVYHAVTAALHPHSW